MGIKAGDAPHISTFSPQGNSCVAVERPREGFVQVKHSREPGRVMFTDTEWENFIKGVKAGEFDLD